MSSVDDIAVVSPSPATLSHGRISVASGFLLSNGSGAVDNYCAANGFSISIGGKTFSGPAGGPILSPAQFNAGAAAAGIRVVSSGGFLSKQELEAMGFTTGVWDLSLVICGTGFVQLTLRCG